MSIFQNKQFELQRQYQVGTVGTYIPQDDDTQDHMLGRGWTHETEVTIHSAYISDQNKECLYIRWGGGPNDWAGITADGFVAKV